MKTLLNLLLAGSLAINAALLFVVTRGALSPDASPAPATAASAAKRTAPKLDRTIWPGLESVNLSTFVAGLRRAGFPTDVIRELLVARLDETFAARKAALDRDTETRPFWKTNSLDEKLQTALSDLDLERRRALRDLLGDKEANLSPYSLHAWRQHYGYLPAAKATEVRELEEQFNELRNRIFNGALATPAGDARRLELGRTESAAIAQILSPEEFEHYDLLTNNTARTIRSWIGLGAFDPTESEFLAIYRPMREYELTFPYSGLSPAEVKEREAAYPIMNAQIKAALGDERFAEFDRSRNWDFQRTNQLASRFELPIAAAIQVWNVQREAQQRAAEIRADSALPGDQRDARLATLAADATATIRSALGPRAFTAYQQVPVGRWLQTIQPNPETAKPSTPGNP